MTDRELVCSEIRALHRAFRINIHTHREWARPVEPMIVGTYNDILAGAQRRGVATAPDCGPFRAAPSHRALFQALGAQLSFLELPGAHTVAPRSLHRRVTPLPQVLSGPSSTP